MIRLILPMIIVLALVVLLLVRFSKPLIRGVAEDMLVSPAQPVLAVSVALDSELHLVDARRADVPCELSMGSALITPTVNLWYALYADETRPARMVSLLAEAQKPYSWPLDMAFVPSGASEHGISTQDFRKKTLDMAGLEGVAVTYTLPVERDPWRAEEESAPWDQGSLVRRFTFLVPLHGMKLVVEYREPVPATTLPLEDDVAVLAAFEERAAQAFRLLRPGKNGTPLPRPASALPYPPPSVSRGELARHIGTLHDTSAR